MDESGTATGATVVWYTNGIWNLPITDTPGKVRMMRGYLDTIGGTTTVSVSGLPTNSAGYDVYVYADGQNKAAVRTGAYQISDAGSGSGRVSASTRQWHADRAAWSQSRRSIRRAGLSPAEFSMFARRPQAGDRRGALRLDPILPTSNSVLSSVVCGLGVVS